MKLNAGKNCSASAILVALGVIVVLAGIAGGGMLYVSSQRKAFYHAAAWQEALMVAEAGVQQAVAQVEQQLTVNPTVFSDGTGLTVSGTTVVLSHGGEGSTGGTASYVITGTSYLVKGVMRPYFVISSTGMVPIYGPGGVSADSADVVLRKLRLSGTSPMAVRKVEVWMKPLYDTALALTTNGLITLNNFKIVIDSYNSKDPNRSDSPAVTGGARLPSSTLGKYNVSPYNLNLAHIGTNDKLIEANNATVYGDAMTNGGVVGDPSHIMGTIRDDFYQPLAPVEAPDWPSGTVSPIYPTQPSVKSITSQTTLVGGTKENPARYVVDSIALAGSNTNLRFTFGTTDGEADPSKSYVEVYVKNGFSISGQGSSTLDVGMNVRIWVAGDVDITGNGLINPSGNALALAIYGIAPPEGTDREFKIAGNGVFYGTVYAPDADLKLAGAGSSGTFVGSIVSKSAFLNGNTRIRYDEAIAGPGVLANFAIAAWFEDTRR